MGLVRFSHVFYQIYTILLIVVSMALYESIIKIRAVSRWVRFNKSLPCLVAKTAHHLASVVEDFPSPHFEDGLNLESKSKSNSVECAICLSRLKGGAAARELHCKHVFHKDCIRRWLESDGATCPLCRSTLLLGGVSPREWQWEEDCYLEEKLCSWFLSWNRGNELHRLVWAR